MHGRSRETTDPRTPTTPGRSHVGRVFTDQTGMGVSIATARKLCNGVFWEWRQLVFVGGLHRGGGDRFFSARSLLTTALCMKGCCSRTRRSTIEVRPYLSVHFGSSIPHPNTHFSKKTNCIPINIPMAMYTKVSFFEKKYWHSNDFRLRSPVIQKTKLTGLCCLYRRTHRTSYIFGRLKNLDQLESFPKKPCTVLADLLVLRKKTSAEERSHTPVRNSTLLSVVL